MPGKFRTAFQGQYDYLANKIDPSELWPKLRDAEILTDWQIQSCRNEQRNPTTMDQVSRMLEMLERRDDVYFEPFCDILWNQGQREVAERLRNNLGPRTN